MAIGVLLDMPGMTREQYDEVCRGLNNGRPLTALAQWPEGGVLFHVAGPTPGGGGWRVVDVWESEEAFQRFGQKLVPLLQKAGLSPVTPEVFPAYNVVTQ